MRLKRGWRLSNLARIDAGDPVSALRAVPPALARRVGRCDITLLEALEDPSVGSRWRRSASVLEIAVAACEVDPHDVALEILLCLGQAVWEEAPPAEQKAWLKMLREEIDAGVEGEIDEAALAEKRAMLASRTSARSRRRLERYACASFAATLAEYVHSLWHDVTVREGPEHLPAVWLHRRLETLARWFPPGRGYRLFPKTL